MTLFELIKVDSLKRAGLLLLLAIALVFLRPSLVQAKILINYQEDGEQFSRSLESLRDLEYQTWQVVAYPAETSSEEIVLRIVGYPGTLRMDHPNEVLVHSGRRDWFLPDITLKNPKLADDPREAAAEFDLSPLLIDLTNNRPLRLSLKGVFTELPIPPYLVSEWRALSQPVQGSDEGN